MKKGLQIPVGILVVVFLCAVGGRQGRAAISSPTNISDCVLWLDGDDIDGDGTAEDAGETYGGVWADKSGNGYDATNAIVARQPALTVGGINGRTTLTWDDIDDYLTIDAGSNGEPLDSSVPFTMFMVVEHSAPVDHKMLFSNSDASGTKDGSYLRNEGGTQIIRAYNNNMDSGDIGFGTNLWMWQNEDTSGAGSALYSIRQDGVLLVAKDTTRTSTSSSDDIVVGRYDPGGADSAGLDGQIAEFIIYDRVLTASEINDVGSYVKTKWGIAVSAPDMSGVPGTITNLQLWLDAADIDGDGTDEGAGETYGGVWTDRSGNGRPATQSTGGRQPAVTPNGLGGRTALKFDGTDDHFESSELSFDPGTPFTAIFVCQWSNVQDAVFFINDGAAGDRDGSRLLSDGADQDLRIFGPNPDTDLDFIPAFSGQQAHIVVFQNSSINATPGTYRVDLDGDNVASYAHTRSGGTVDTLYLGALSSAAGSFDGEWGEVLIYGHVLPSNELNTVGFYLQEKWGIDGSYTGLGRGVMVIVR